jgi:zinc protease
MGYLLGSMTPDVVDGQREVVKNERRQSYENEPYGKANLRLTELLYPPDHPYHWPTIGYMPDLDAAGYDDVVGFYKKYYTPGNASLVIAGDIDPVQTRQQVETWFSDVPSAPKVPELKRRRRPSPALPSLAHAAPSAAGRRGPRRAGRHSGRRQELSPLQTTRL